MKDFLLTSLAYLTAITGLFLLMTVKLTSLCIIAPFLIAARILDGLWNTGKMIYLFLSLFDYGFLGDIHKTNQVLDHAGHIRYCGSTVQQNHGETNDKGFPDLGHSRQRDIRLRTYYD